MSSWRQNYGTPVKQIYFQDIKNWPNDMCLCHSKVLEGASSPYNECMENDGDRGMRKDAGKIKL